MEQNILSNDVIRQKFDEFETLISKEYYHRNDFTNSQEFYDCLTEEQRSTYYFDMHSLYCVMQLLESTNWTFHHLMSGLYPGVE